MKIHPENGVEWDNEFLKTPEYQFDNPLGLARCIPRNLISGSEKPAV